MKTSERFRAFSRIAAIASVIAISGCGGSVNSQVADLCMSDLTAQLGATFEGDAKQFAKVAHDEGEGIYVIESTILIDKGLTSETTREFMCRVQTDPAGKAAPTIILLQLLSQVPKSES
jgi:hypothetical protein